jgi:beta-lactamase class A
VRDRAESLGLRRTLLLDIVRDERGPDDAPQLSVGSARELAILFGRLHAGTVVDETTSRLVRGWLGLGTDLSMVASAFGLDPLAHLEADHGLTLFNKTGTDTGIRSEAGVVTGPRGGVAYAVTMRFNDAELPGRLAVLEAMRVLGTDVLEYVY